MKDYTHHTIDEMMKEFNSISLKARNLCEIIRKQSKEIEKLKLAETSQKDNTIIKKNTMKTIRLVNIPKRLLPLISSNNNATLWYNDNIVNEISILHQTYFRINTNRRQYRVPLDTALMLDIQYHL